MPLYRCSAAPDALDASQRSAVARAITEIHCDLTTAPPTFVHVQFHDASSTQTTPVALHGGLRAGRPAELTTRLVERCTKAVAEIVGVDVDQVSMRTSETPASWIFEGGRVLPEPGEEAAWLAANA